MTKDEAIAVARAAGKADGGCSSCAEAVCDTLNEANLGWLWRVYDEEDDGGPLPADEASIVVDVDSYFVILLSQTNDNG